MRGTEVKYEFYFNVKGREGNVTKAAVIHHGTLSADYFVDPYRNVFRLEGGDRIPVGHMAGDKVAVGKYNPDEGQYIDFGPAGRFEFFPLKGEAL